MSDINNNDEEKYCSMCGRSEKDAGHMVHMPFGMYLCSDCMDKVSSTMEERMKDMPGMDSSGGALDLSKMMQQMGMAVPAGDDIYAASAANDLQTDPSVNPDGEEEGKNDKEKKEEKKKGPKISFMNLGDLPFGNPFGGGAKVKRAKPGEAKPLIALKDIPAPHKIKAMLDEYVVGQEKAKRVMSVAVYNHYKRVATNMAGEDIEIEKSNMLMLGPTGSGKTYLVRTLARILDVPLAVTDATSLTEAGYIGDDIESVVSKLLTAADNDADRAEQGIIYIDEIDKIARKSDVHSRDVNGESVQQGMLKLLEGAEIEVPVGASSKNAMVPTTRINTRNILFICGGAFPGLEEIINERLKKNSAMGFTGEIREKEKKDRKIFDKAETEDIRKFGMIPEFVGRLPMMFALEGLDEDMLVRILKEPKNAIVKQYEKLLELDGVKLEFTDGALRAIAAKAMSKETGARALRAVLDEYMTDIMFEIPKDDNIGKVTITEEYIEKKGGPLIENRTEEIPKLTGA